MNLPHAGKFPKYRQNLKTDGFYIYSYNTKVAKIKKDELVELGYWSMTTRKHVNYAADYIGIPVKHFS